MQTPLPRGVRAALKINVGYTLRHVVSGGQVRILKMRPVTELSGMSKRPSQASASVEAMDEAVAKGATS